MKIIGLTGCVGSGKSTVGRIMEKNFNIKMVMTDELGHKAMEVGTESYEKIVDYFGTEILCEDRSIDRGKLSQIVFEEDEKLKKLNNIIHPWVKDYLRRDVQKEIEAKVYSHYIMESAILFQSGLDAMCEENWFVDASDEIRRERLMRDRGYSEEKIASIMAKQLENEHYKTCCNKVIYNNEGEAEILQQLEKLLV